jgi:TRAP-type mannitol/chloroaromatic compound transport system permease small subunit
MVRARAVSALDRAIGCVHSLGRYLVLPIAILLFLQWPLRDLVRAFSREANDIGQWMFALYVAMAVTAATRANMHLATDVVARRYSARARDRLSRIGILLGLLPWAVFVMLASVRIVRNSVSGFEAFPDTANPGYFIIKLALWILAGLVLLQGLSDVLRPRREGDP